jgi:predicted transcriptional regulator
MVTNPVDAHIGSRMSKLREDRLIQLTELATRLNIKPTILADYEAGRARVPAAIMYHYCKVLEVEIKTVFEGMPSN